MTRYDQNTVRQLTEKYFNATITPEEMQLLSDCAGKFTGDNPPFRISDTQLLDDLRLIALIDGYSALSLDEIAADTPPGLESSLEKHISRLARAGRKRFLLTRVIPAGIAAAVGLIMIAPISDLNHTDNVRETHIALSGSDTTSSGNNLMADIPETDKTCSQPEKSIGSYVASANISKNINFQANESSPLPETESSNTQGARHQVMRTPDIPAISDPFLDIKPMLSSAVVDPSIIMQQPLSTLSQSVSNVYESVGIVSTAFAGISETFEMVNASLSVLSPNSIEMNQF